MPSHTIDHRADTKCVCGEEPLTCGGCGEAFCPCQRKNDPPDIGYLMQELCRCESCVAMAAVEIARAWELVSKREKLLVKYDTMRLRDKRAMMRKGGTWTVSSS